MMATVPRFIRAMMMGKNMLVYWVIFSEMSYSSALAISNLLFSWSLLTNALTTLIPVRFSWRTWFRWSSLAWTLVKRGLIIRMK